MAMPLNTQVSMPRKETKPSSLSEEKSNVERSRTPKITTKSRRAGSVELPFLTLFILAILFYAWLQRNEGHLTAETGVGYYLGIIGSVMMITLLLYPLRKRIRALQIIGNVRTWFRIHMILGVIGPTLIILHSNFSLGSLNSTMAFSSMLIVALSGFVGRFFYARIHRGLYGHKLNAKELINDVAIEKTALGSDENFHSKIISRITAYEESRLAGHIGFWRSLGFTFMGPFVRYKLKKQLMLQVKSSLKNSNVSAREFHSQLATFSTELNQYFQAVGRAEAFTFYERLFALWHLFHLPLFVILVLAALAHVFAVHLF
jgi:hypothetical protein